MSGLDTFDPDQAAVSDGLFGLPFDEEQAKIIVIPVPFDATTSYGSGTSLGPAAILRASRQVDLFDGQFGRTWEAGIYMQPIDDGILQLAERTRQQALPIINLGGADERHLDLLAEVRAAGDRVNEFVALRVQQVLDQKKLPVILGGDHSTPFSAIQACAQKFQSIGILQIDAHMDLRQAYEGFQWSHASIMYNVLEQVSGVDKLVQVGIRDFGERELAYAKNDARVRVFFDNDCCSERLAPEGESVWTAIAGELPDNIYISCDIDGFDPSLCPNTGTPVPGGLSFREFQRLLEAIRQAKKRVIGFDLVEVCPQMAHEWDANVGARVLYKLCGLASLNFR
ncbi:MAG TPA: agmatinase family protein [Pirellulaceae bacterium]|nr:agmatinase family protein [Pirellulaceae bacterium]HMO93603.1 agmatinase family protein [Pirellulaceae bacterium]HMP70527.1 agmatinase family protein [Pirellulaceae bacterium]